MINATPPQIPNYDETVELLEPSSPTMDRKTAEPLWRFSSRWYQFFDSAWRFMVALRNAPQAMPQAQLAAFQAKLAKKDTGMQIWVSDYNHLLRWAGSAWGFAPSDPGSNWYADFNAGGPAPGVGWHVADGTNVNVLKADGTTVQVTLSNVANRYLRL